jgi:cation transport regulator ChaC
MNKKRYFAYGSNMNPERMRKRMGYLPPSRKAVLQDYNLTFNKISSKNPSEGVANIIPLADSQVEGILYEVTDQDIAKLDAYEGVPTNYIRHIVKVDCKGELINALTYIAVKVKDGLKPSRDYLNHLLAAKESLSEDYYQQILDKAKLKQRFNQ